MNPISPITATQQQAFEIHTGSDSDSNIDDDDAAAAAEYYQPVSAVDSDDEANEAQHLPNGMSSMELNDGVEVEEEAEIGEAVDSAAIRNAIREDESRRSAPLTPENANRVMEAMRGISFPAVAPDWADQIPEENWIDQLRRLRQSPQS